MRFFLRDLELIFYFRAQTIRIQDIELMNGNNYNFMNNQKSSQQATGKRTRDADEKKEKPKYDDKPNKKIEEKQHYHYIVAENTSSLFANYAQQNLFTNNKQSNQNTNGNTNMFSPTNLFGNNNNSWNLQNNN